METDQSEQQSCIGLACVDVMCDGLFCPASSKWNLANISEKIRDIELDLKSKLRLHELNGNLPFVGSPYYRALANSSWAGIDRLYQTLDAGNCGQHASSRQVPPDAKVLEADDEEKLCQLEQAEMDHLNKGSKRRKRSSCREFGQRCFCCHHQMEAATQGQDRKQESLHRQEEG